MSGAPVDPSAIGQLSSDSVTYAAWARTSGPSSDSQLDTFGAGVSHGRMEIGEIWAFRDHPKAVGTPISRVEIIRMDGPRKQGDLHVRFHDGPETGMQEWVSRAQLVVSWSHMEEFLVEDRRWAAIMNESQDVRGSREFEAVKLVFEHVQPKNRLRIRHTKADAGVLEVADLDDLAQWLKLDAHDLRNEPLAFVDRSGTYVAPWSTTCLIARRV